jgi:hypothetical protein
MNKQFYKTRKERREYHGERYFQLAFDSETVLQVCVSPSTEMRRGRSNNIGVYIISRLTFVSNYFAMDYVEPCTRKVFVSQYNKITEMLRPKN